MQQGLYSPTSATADDVITATALTRPCTFHR